MVLIRKWRLFTREEEVRRNMVKLRGPIDARFVLQQLARRAKAMLRIG